ncbi:hypothetical protein ABPG74_001762 [Tetrahymena malaccensis]
MSEYFLKINELQDDVSSAISPLKSISSKRHLQVPSMDSQRLISTLNNLSEVNESTAAQQQQLDHRYMQFKDLIERREENPDLQKLTIDEQELIASVLYDFHHFKILIRSQRRIEFSIKLFKHIKIGWLERGEFFFHKGDTNKTDLICILNGKAALFQKKSESFINQEMDLLGRIVNLNQQITKIEKSAPTISNDMSDSIHQLKQRIEHNEDKLNLLRNKEEDDLLKAYNYQKYFLTENVCSFRRIKYLECGSTLGEAQVVNGCSCDSTVVCVSKCFYFYISSQAYREIFGLEISKNSFICNILKQNFPGAKDDSLRRVSYDFKEEIYEYNKVIFEENDPANLFMIVRQGEVEAIRRIDTSTNNNQQCLESTSPLTPEVKEINGKYSTNKSSATSPLQSPTQSRTFFHQQNNQKQQQPQVQQNLLKKFKGKNQYKEISIGILGEGQILGIEDAYNNRKTRSFKAISKSNETIIYYINKKLLDDVILLNDDYKLKKGIKNQSKSKSEYYNSRTDNLINFEQANLKQKENFILQENMKKQYLPESKNFKYLVHGWIKQKEQEELKVDNSSKIKQSIPTLNQIQSYNLLDDETTQPTEQNLFDTQQSPIKIQRRSLLKSLTCIQTAFSKTQDSNALESQNLKQQTPLESSHRRKKYQKDNESISPRKIALVQAISMPKLDDFQFKSDIDIINQQIEIKEQCIQFYHQQKDKYQVNQNTNINNHNAQQSQPNLFQQLNKNQYPSHEQLQFEETKKKILFQKNFQNENKKNYRLKSENSFINSILKKTTSLKLDIPQLKFQKSQQKPQINEANDDTSQNSQTASPTTVHQALSKKNSLISLHKRGSDIISSLQLDNNKFERKSEVVNVTQNNFHIQKQIPHLSSMQQQSTNFKHCKSQSSFSQFSLNLDQNHNNQNEINTLEGESQQKNQALNQFTKALNANAQLSKQNSQIQSKLQLFSEQQKVQLEYFKNSPRQTSLDVKAHLSTGQSGYLHNPQNSIFYTNSHKILQNQPNSQNQSHNKSIQQVSSDRQINIPNQQELNTNFFVENSDINTPSTFNNTPSQLPQIAKKQLSQREPLSSYHFQQNENVSKQQSIDNQNNSVSPNQSELPFIKNQSTTKFTNQHKNDLSQTQQQQVVVQKQGLKSEGFADIVKRIGLDPSQFQEQSKFQILKNVFKIQKKQTAPNVCTTSGSQKRFLSNYPLFQRSSRKNASLANSPRKNNLGQNPQSNKSPAKPIQQNQQQFLVEFRNESPLKIGKINYSVK